MLGLTRPGAQSRTTASRPSLVRLVEEVVVLVEKGHGEAPRPAGGEDSPASPSARVDPAQIQQVLLNLLINARQAMPEGGQVRVRLGLDATGRRVELSVADTGVGIAPADLRRIFEPFYSTKIRARRRGAGGHRPGPGRLPRHRRSPPRPPPRREPAGPGLDLHADPPRLPTPRGNRRPARGRVNLSRSSLPDSATLFQK